MGSESNRIAKPLTIIVFKILCCTSISSFAQISQSFKAHEVIELNDGLKIEILKCRNEGPVEECDCIYYTEKRQTGTRIWQNVNRIKEEIKAADLAKAIKTAESKTTARNKDTSTITTDERTAANKENLNKIENIANKEVITEQKKQTTLNVVVTTATNIRQVTLEEAVRQADSTAKARSEVLDKTLLESLSADSSEMDNIYIPKVTAEGETNLEVSNSKRSSETFNSTANTTQEASSSDSLNKVSNKRSLGNLIKQDPLVIPSTSKNITSEKPASTNNINDASDIQNIDRKAVSKSAAKNVKSLKVLSAGCSFTIPVPVLDSTKFSFRLVKRKIYENYIFDQKNEKQDTKIGVTFISIKIEDQFTNKPGNSTTQALNLPLALPGSLIYPVKVRLRICEQSLVEIKSTTIDTSYNFFKDSNGAWTCSLTQ